jgi:23S rRNA pseudouridine2605 synthase
MPSRSENTPGPRGGELRLQAYLARAGVASRRASEELIAAGRVKVNGAVVSAPGSKVRPGHDKVLVDGSPVEQVGITWVALHKPRGFVTTRIDPYSRRTVYELLPEKYHTLFHVGRLDRDSEGVLLLTNDGETANRMLHPSFGTTKEYLVDVYGQPPSEVIAQLLKGVELADGVAKAEEVQRLHQTGEDTFRLRIVLREGKKREIRRMMDAVGHPVHRLLRKRFGPVELGELPSGKWRVVSPVEISSLNAGSDDTPKRRKPAAEPEAAEETPARPARKAASPRAERTARPAARTGDAPRSAPRPGAASRGPAKGGAASRGPAKAGGASRGPTKGRAYGDGERPARPHREEGEDRRPAARAPRGEAGDRPKRPFTPRAGGFSPGRGKPGDRPARPARPSRGDGDERPTAVPRDEGARADAPRGEWPTTRRNSAEREERPARGAGASRPSRPFSSRPDKRDAEDRPRSRSRDDRPARDAGEERPGRGPRETRPPRGGGDERPARGGFKPSRPEKPTRARRDERERPDRDERPERPSGPRKAPRAESAGAASDGPPRGRPSAGPRKGGAAPSGGPRKGPGGPRAGSAGPRTGPGGPRKGPGGARSGPGGPRKGPGGGPRKGPGGPRGGGPPRGGRK